jgi:crotonobetainyl-CoA:carnitine CoA-transferase CaiB-like acyl-CoA transferase
MTARETLPFTGLRVLSFCIGAVSPEISRWLAEYGAETVKVESRVFPELMRRVSNMPGQELETSAGFNDANRAKLSCAIDMTNPEGRAVALRLAEKADVIVENYRGDVMRNWGLDYESVARLNPSVVYLSSQGFGRGGPDQDYPTMGPNLAPSFGLFSLWGHPDEAEPIGAMLNHPDHIAGKMGMIAVVAALDERQRTGRGRFIDLSQAEAGALMMGEAYLEHFINGREARPIGNQSANASPHGAYPCLGDDRWCVLSVREPGEWEALCELLGWDDFAADPALLTIEGRLARAGEIDARIGSWTITMEPAHVAEILQGVGVPAGYVMNAADFLADAHLAEREAIVEIDHPVTGPQKYLANTGFRIEGFEPLDDLRPPLLGEHTDEVLKRWLRLKDEEIGSLRERRAVGY